MKKNILESKLNIIKLNERLLKLKKDTGMVIQSILFKKEIFNKKSAIKWLKDHNYKSSSIDITDNYLRFRQKQPKRFNTFKTINLDNGIKAIVANSFNSKFVASLILKNVSKFSEIKDINYEDINVPMEIELQILCEGQTRDGNIRDEDLQLSLDKWSSLPIIDFHDNSSTDVTQHKISDRKGYLINNPKIKYIDGKKWIVNDGIITDKYLAYLIQFHYNNSEFLDPLEISAEFKSIPYYYGTQKCMSNITPYLISIVDKGHIKGNKITFKK